MKKIVATVLLCSALLGFAQFHPNGTAADRGGEPLTISKIAADRDGEPLGIVGIQ